MNYVGKNEKWGIGIDMGGTKIEAAIVGDQGKLRDQLRIPTNSQDGAERIIERTLRAVKELMGRNSDVEVAAAGIGIAGQIDNEGEYVIHAPNLKWSRVNLRQQLVNVLAMPVFICNDVRAAAWGEWSFGAGRGKKDVACIFVGTGVGGAFICDGKMLHGFNNSAGEIGHMVVKVNGELCTCGNSGCLEAIAGGWAIRKKAQQLALQDQSAAQTMIDLAGGIASINAKTVFLAANQGDKAAFKIVGDVVAALIAGVISVINVFGPDRVILGGGIIEGMPTLIQRIETGVKKHALQAAISNVQILQAELHGNAGTMGAAMFALNNVQGHNKER
ncbi:MAG: hypothetical protein K0Q79_2098 [Flavipsychrobacter sp.]|jgi:glucokinase|nr:hypothetical protein [Flavipsychrobacter sp.]